MTSTSEKKFKKDYDAFLKPVEKSIGEHRLLESTVSKASLYALLAPGKRIRPVLLMAMAAQAPHKHNPAAAAVAVEMVHTFSLIHDDMPCIDNATLRRGQPCTHKAYGEAAGLLAGDLLLNEAYRVLSRNYPSALAGKLTHILSETTFGLLEGEWADIEAEEKEIDEVDIDFIYLNKTAKMISAPVKMGLTIAGYSEKKILPFALAAEDVGIAFQIIDDLLDINSSAAKLGKDVDQDERKKTYLKRHGEKWCRDKARELSLSAQKTFKQLPRPQFILSLINALMEREK